MAQRLEMAEFSNGHTSLEVRYSTVVRGGREAGAIAAGIRGFVNRRVGAMA
jgi:hypothetical protein